MAWIRVFWDRFGCSLLASFALSTWTYLPRSFLSRSRLRASGGLRGHHSFLT
jgi:hypothetical protein